MAGDRIHTGSRHQYLWLTSEEQDMETLLTGCPAVVLNQFLVFTEIDSGVPELNDSTQRAGWEVRRGIAYTGEINAVESLIPQEAGYDPGNDNECYIFDAPPDLGERVKGFKLFENSPPPAPRRLEPFVSWSQFDLASHDEIALIITGRFWEQIELIQPISYVGDGRSRLTFVTKNKEMFDAVETLLSGAPMKVNARDRRAESVKAAR